MKVEWTVPALEDLESLIEYIAEDSPTAARRVAARIGERVGSLASYPRSGRTGRIDRTRELVVAETPYIVAYRVRERSVQVLAIQHGSREWPDAFELVGGFLSRAMLKSPRRGAARLRSFRRHPPRNRR